MTADKSCATCAHTNSDMICVNLDSEHCGQAVFERDSCEEWKGESMRELKPCPYCGYTAALEPMQVRKGYEADIQCLSCPASMHTITYNTEQEAVDAAISAWNKRTSEPLAKPVPLTLEQLQKREGKPVWTQYIDGSGGHWGLVATSEYGVHAIIDDDTARWDSRYDKEWLAYDRPPKEQTPC